MVSCGCVSVVPRWCLGGVSVESQSSWWFGGALLMSRWCRWSRWYLGGVSWLPC